MTAGGLSREASLTGSVTRGGMLLAMGARGETWHQVRREFAKNADVRVWRPCCKLTTPAMPTSLLFERGPVRPSVSFVSLGIACRAFVGTRLRGTHASAGTWRRRQQMRRRGLQRCQARRARSLRQRTPMKDQALVQRSRRRAARPSWRWNGQQLQRHRWQTARRQTARKRRRVGDRQHVACEPRAPIVPGALRALHETHSFHVLYRR